jgi:hypothetical protein
MKFTRAAVYSALVVAAASTTTFSVTQQVSAFAPIPASKTTRCSRNSAFSTLTSSPFVTKGSNSDMSSSPTALSYSVGIVGATGAVGKEIRQVLETRQKLPIDKLRIFGSSGSAGSTVSTGGWGDVTVELFDVDKARECDVVFLAVDGDFALEHAEKIAAGPDGAVVIDNSVSTKSKDS